jgi:Putative beta-barrel porin-2, OmpL-like. bbp2
MRRKKQTTATRAFSVSPIIKACIGGVIIAGLPVSNVHAQDAGRLEKLEKENADLKKRLDAIETKEGAAPSKSYIVKAMSEVSISGFVQASYFYNTARPDDGVSDAYLWNTKDNSFSLNKFKLSFASKPVATDKWDAGFKASVIFGDDAPQLNTGGINGNNGTNAPSSNTSFNDLREAYVELNVPIGTGLNIKAGELISLLNYESGDGGAANVNFSQGNQWWFTGNGPSAGVQATYNFTDAVGLVARVDNGLFQGPVDNNSGKAFSTSLNLKPSSKLWMNIYGFWDDQPGDNETKGFGTIGGFQVTEKLGTGYEFDYFNFDNAGDRTDVWSIGGWSWYDFTPTTGFAFRADFIDSHGGVLGPAMRPGSGITTTDVDGNLASFTLTMNWKPAPNIKVQPEIRLDTTSFAEGLDSHGARLTLGMGVSYMF